MNHLKWSGTIKAVGLAAILSVGAGGAFADTIEGNWRTKSGETAAIGKCGGSFCIRLKTGKHAGKTIGRLKGFGRQIFRHDYRSGRRQEIFGQRAGQRCIAEAERAAHSRSSAEPRPGSGSNRVRLTLTAGSGGQRAFWPNRIFCASLSSARLLCSRISLPISMPLETAGRAFMVSNQRRSEGKSFRSWPWRS